jgi:HK97 gp10 family phage protein
MARGRRETITIHGMEKLRAKLIAMPFLVRSAGGRAVRDETYETRDDMKRGAPYKTGELRESIQAEYDEKLLRGRAVATARYATFVEHGTDDTKAQPFVQPAAERARRRFPKRVRAEIAAELKRL